MHNNQFTEVVLGLLDECKELLVKKGEDYSSNEDRLDNFKSAEQVTSLTQWQCWEALFFKHIQAIRTYFKSGRKGLNEDIKHRLRDAINYLIILEAMLVEEEQANAPQTLDKDAFDADLTKLNPENLRKLLSQEEAFPPRVLPSLSLGEDPYKAREAAILKEFREQHPEGRPTKEEVMQRPLGMSEAEWRRGIANSQDYVPPCH